VQDKINFELEKNAASRFAETDVPGRRVVRTREVVACKFARVLTQRLRRTVNMSTLVRGNGGILHCKLLFAVNREFVFEITY
jgi:hypothetical protein